MGRNQFLHPAEWDAPYPPNFLLAAGSIAQRFTSQGLHYQPSSVLEFTPRIQSRDRKVSFGVGATIVLFPTPKVTLALMGRILFD